MSRAAAGLHPPKVSMARLEMRGIVLGNGLCVFMIYEPDSGARFTQSS